MRTFNSLLALLRVSNVAGLCPSPEGAIATGRERGMTGGHGVRFCKRGGLDAVDGSAACFHGGDSSGG